MQLAATSDTARLDAELLMAHALGVSRTDLLLRHMNSEPPAQFRSILARRLTHEPVAYILGSQPFYGLDLEVTPAVLIPRGGQRDADRGRAGNAIRQADHTHSRPWYGFRSAAAGRTHTLARGGGDRAGTLCRCTRGRGSQCRAAPAFRTRRHCRGGLDPARVEYRTGQVRSRARQSALRRRYRRPCAIGPRTRACRSPLCGG